MKLKKILTVLAGLSTAGAVQAQEPADAADIFFGSGETVPAIVQPAANPITLESYTKTDFGGNQTWLNMYSSFFNGGIGRVNRDGKDSFSAAGALRLDNDLFPTTIGFSHIRPEGADDLTEIQGLTQLTDSFALGMGYAQPDTSFGRVVYTGNHSGLDFLVSGQVKKTGGDLDPGFYGIVSNENFMIGGGYDGSQLRLGMGLIAPETDSNLRPTLDVLYIDNKDGPRIILANASLSYQGGFLSHAARTGRILGSTGTHFQNYISPFEPNFNREADLQDKGKLLNFRAFYMQTPDGSERIELSAVAFPFGSYDNYLQGVFMGAGHTITDKEKYSSVMAGYSVGLFDNTNLNIGITHDFRGIQQDRVTVSISCRY